MICSACRHARVLLRRSAVSPSGLAALVTTTHPVARARAPAASPFLHHARAFSATPLRASSSSSSSSSIDAASPAPAESVSKPIPKPDFLDAAESHVWDLLVAEFDPQELSVRDISGGCGSMYGIEISSEKFRGANMLKQQRMVNAALKDLVKDWHGVQLKTRVP